MRNRKSPRKSRSRADSKRRQAQSKGHKSKGKNRGQGGFGHKQKTFLGRIQKNPRGFAFIIPQDRNAEDVYVSEYDARPLLNDDVVEYSVHRNGQRLAGSIHKIIKRGQQEVAGRIETRNGRTYLHAPEGEWFEVQGMTDAEENDWVIGRINHYPTEERSGAIEIEETLGAELQPKHDLRIALSKFALPHKFSQAALDTAEALVKEAEEETHNKARKDHTSLPYVTIDGETAKDFDDAILVEVRKDPAFVLYVAIADVSFFVRPHTALDKDARARATSVYFPGVAIPMLPERLSNDLCSLRPRERKLALTAEIHFDRDGKIVKSKFYTNVIKTAHRLTYTRVQEFFDGKREGLEDVAKPLDAAYALYKKLLDQRKQRGVLDFNLPEAQIDVDAEGNPLGVIRAPRYDAHKLIEEFMIAANQVVAEALRESHTPALYRVHERPEPSTLEDVNNLMKRLAIPQYVKEITPKALAKVLIATKDHPAAPTLHQAILRLQKQARYHDEPLGHFGLALNDYTHFTSPIRRYPDLAVHRAIKSLIGVSARTDKKEETESEMSELGPATSERERRAMEAERFVVRRKQCWFMLKYLGHEFNGKICGLTSKGIFVQIPEFAIEGYLPGEALKEEYEFDEEHMCLRKRPGHDVLTMGDEIKVQVARVSVEDGEITFSQDEL